VPRRGIYDNMKTAVDKVKKGKGRIVNALRGHVQPLPVRPDCNVASGWEKGVVEKNVQDSRRRIWIEAVSGASARSPNSTPGWPSAAGRCGRTAPPRNSQFSVAEMLEHEQPHLMPMPEPFDGYVENPARVSSTCLVSVARNRYSVPCELAGQQVSTRLYPAGWWSWPTTRWWPATNA
jgi:hypothetical protein